MTPSWNAYGPHGNLLASFNALDLAQRYQAERAALGISVTIEPVFLPVRRAA